MKKGQVVTMKNAQVTMDMMDQEMTTNMKEEKTMDKMMNAAERPVSRMVFARDLYHSMDTRTTRLNNNVLVVGASGCGKTGSFVRPNILCTEDSIVVADTKNQLCAEMREGLLQRGYKVVCLDFVHPERSVGFNPMDAVRYDAGGRKGYREQDLERIAATLLPDDLSDERFWINAARMVLVSLMAFVMETLDPEEQHFGSVCRLYAEMSREIAANRGVRGWEGVSFFKALEAGSPDSLAVRNYRMYSGNFPADKCWASIEQFVSNALTPFNYEENARMLCTTGYDLRKLGQERTALFVNLSDTDRSMDGVINIFYTQLFQTLCRYTDGLPGYRLPVPVHIILDDFAANVQIRDFDKIISVIRSREISASVILQSLSQLRGMYNEGQASTIINNCDTMLYMGGQDMETARFFADKAGRLPERILELDVDHEWVFMRGRAALLTEKIVPYSAVREDFEA